ncbi:unnamed protein product [Caenorhabditis brenneri]
MDKYQVYHYFKYYEPNHSILYMSYAGMTLICLCSIIIPLYLQCTTEGETVIGAAISDETYVQWHLEKEIKEIKAKTKKKKGKKKRSSLSTDEEEL